MGGRQIQEKGRKAEQGGERKTLVSRKKISSDITKDWKTLTINTVESSV